MPPERAEQERHEIMRRLELEYQEAEAKLRKASHDHSIARVDKHNAEARLFRAQSPPEGSNYCLMCWVNHQRLSRLRPVPSAGPRLSDRWTCASADCGYTEDRRVLSQTVSVKAP
jgi:hypothetical protein